MKQAFTLIELLVVVLIIGILSAVALPQYEKIVERSKATQAFALLNPLIQAYQASYLENGTYVASLDELAISLPSSFTGEDANHLSNGEWEVVFSNSYGIQVSVKRKSGKYKDAVSFLYVFAKRPDPVPVGQWLCFENIATFPGKADDYCKKILNGTKDASSGSSDRVYRL
ncbi:MAG: prepilin-type N-terminal cleavage/methylation domain-containing protein [Elusimicrobiaceae bacterium]|nr:prepilin-type N-terminal cleavage/methylation domain-containing protein [Elusimicrobiaceae bacterium]